MPPGRTALVALTALLAPLGCAMVSGIDAFTRGACEGTCNEAGAIISASGAADGALRDDENEDARAPGAVRDAGEGGAADDARDGVPGQLLCGDAVCLHPKGCYAPRDGGAPRCAVKSDDILVECLDDSACAVIGARCCAEFDATYKIVESLRCRQQCFYPVCTPGADACAVDTTCRAPTPRTPPICTPDD